VCPCCAYGSVSCDRLEASVFTPLPGQATRYPFGAEHMLRKRIVHAFELFFDYVLLGDLIFECVG
jgi:hypothetical protein